MNQTTVTNRRYQKELGFALLLYMALLVGALLLSADMQAGAPRTAVLLSPLLESFFDLLTRSRLLELADLERPLDRQAPEQARLSARLLPAHPGAVRGPCGPELGRPPGRVCCNGCGS